jgi:hypothetical protein
MAVLRVGEQHAAEGVGSRFISCSEARPIAVEDIAKPMPATSATAGERPSAQPASVTAALVAATCAVPMPKMGLRSCQTRRGLSSRPTRNSSSTTPNSAKWRIASGAVTSARPQGPMAAPAAR